MGLGPKTSEKETFQNTLEGGAFIPFLFKILERFRNVECDYGKRLVAGRFSNLGAFMGALILCADCPHWSVESKGDDCPYLSGGSQS